ncbi:MAG TPA: hypothetical protein VN660_00950 [Steroidobacteraceae bacterium]|nr:hypothetical protein [Steroidobacteraceae bacterium]
MSSDTYRFATANFGWYVRFEPTGRDILATVRSLKPAVARQLPFGAELPPSGAHPSFTKVAASKDKVLDLVREEITRLDGPLVDTPSDQ